MAVSCAFLDDGVRKNPRLVHREMYFLLNLIQLGKKWRTSACLPEEKNSWKIICYTWQTWYTFAIVCNCTSKLHLTLSCSHIFIFFTKTFHVLFMLDPSRKACAWKCACKMSLGELKKLTFSLCMCTLRRTLRFTIPGRGLWMITLQPCNSVDVVDCSEAAFLLLLKLDRTHVRAAFPSTLSSSQREHHSLVRCGLLGQGGRAFLGGGGRV